MHISRAPERYPNSIREWRRERDRVGEEAANGRTSGTVAKTEMRSIEVEVRSFENEFKL